MFFRRVKRGQFTMFVIVGILILFIFSLLIYIQGVLVKKQLELQAQKQINDYIDQNSIREYVQSCLDIISNEAVIKASMQGGVFDFSGMRYDIDYVRQNDTSYNDTFNIPIAVKPNLDCGAVRNFPPDYPYPDTPLVPSSILTTMYETDPMSCYTKNIFLLSSGFFGLNNLTRLCDWNGTNRINATSTGFGFITCERPTYNNVWVKDSIQENMQTFIAAEIKKCVNFTYIQSRSSGNITVQDDPKAYITFNKGGFKASVDYPFTINIGSQPIIKIVDFSIDKNIPFKELYDYVFNLIVDDVSQADFDIINDKASPDLIARGLYHGYIVSKITNVDKNYTDIVQVIDNSTRINGRPMMFQYAVMNRRPALDFISFTRSINGVDILVGENETITLSPQGYDPDEDYVHYNYSLWKEDYNEVFNDSNSKCTNYTQTSFQYVIENCTIRNNTLKPHNFTNSLLYKNYGMQNASYVTNSKDKGFHIVRISVWDRASLLDWQDVRIFIFDLPVAKVTGSNLYSDVAPNLASWEDPYVLDGSNSTIGLSAFIPPYNSFSKFLWIDSVEFSIEKLIKNTTSMKLFIPQDINVTNITLMNLPNLTFAKYYPVQTHNIILIVNTTFGITSKANFSVDVKQCLPHHNATNTIFPYNSNPYDLMNSLYADHACCTPQDTFAGSSVTCFNNVSYGGNLSFYNYSKRPATPAYQIKYITTQSPGARFDNDIFMQSFTRACSNDRGNACTGAITETRTDIEKCDDTNNNAPAQFRDERCAGPPTKFIVGNSWINSSSNNVHCFNYSNRQTYELKAKIPTKSGGVADGSCANGQQCGVPGIGFDAYIFGQHGRYLCNAYCDGKGGCTSPGDCVCSTAGCPLGGGSPQCNGLLGPTGSGPPTSNICSASKTWMAYTCSSCGLVDANDNICRDSTTWAAGCTASLQCGGNMHHPYDELSTTNTYCDSQCKFQACPNNYAYNFVAANPPASACLTTCTVDTDCSTGHSCCTAAQFGVGACNALNNNKCM